MGRREHLSGRDRQIHLKSGSGILFDTVAGPTYDSIDILMQSWDRQSYLEAQRLWFMLLNHGYRMPGTASTDASFDGPGKGVPGRARVYTNLQGPPSIAKIAQAIRAGRNFVTTGPLLLLGIAGHGAGDTIHVNRRSDYPVQIRVWPSGAIGERLTQVELIRNGEVVRTFQ